MPSILNLISLPAQVADLTSLQVLLTVVHDDRAGGDRRTHRMLLLPAVPNPVVLHAASAAGDPDLTVTLSPSLSAGGGVDGARLQVTRPTGARLRRIIDVELTLQLSPPDDTGSGAWLQLGLGLPPHSLDLTITTSGAEQYDLSCLSPTVDTTLAVRVREGPSVQADVLAPPAPLPDDGTIVLPDTSVVSTPRTPTAPAIALRIPDASTPMPFELALTITRAAADLHRSARLHLLIDSHDRGPTLTLRRGLALPRLQSLVTAPKLIGVADWVHVDLDDPPPTLVVDIGDPIRLAGRSGQRPSALGDRTAVRLGRGAPPTAAAPVGAVLAIDAQVSVRGQWQHPDEGSWQIAPSDVTGTIHLGGVHTLEVVNDAPLAGTGLVDHGLGVHLGVSDTRRLRAVVRTPTAGVRIGARPPAGVATHVQKDTTVVGSMTVWLQRSATGFTAGSDGELHDVQVLAATRTLRPPAGVVSPGPVVEPVDPDSPPAGARVTMAQSPVIRDDIQLTLEGEGAELTAEWVAARPLTTAVTTDVGTSHTSLTVVMPQRMEVALSRSTGRYRLHTPADPMQLTRLLRTVGTWPTRLTDPITDVPIGVVARTIEGVTTEDGTPEIRLLNVRALGVRWIDVSVTGDPAQQQRVEATLQLDDASSTIRVDVAERSTDVQPRALSRVRLWTRLTDQTQLTVLRRPGDVELRYRGTRAMGATASPGWDEQVSWHWESLRSIGHLPELMRPLSMLSEVAVRLPVKNEAGTVIGATNAIATVHVLPAMLTLRLATATHWAATNLPTGKAATYQVPAGATTGTVDLAVDGEVVVSNVFVAGPESGALPLTAFPAPERMLLARAKETTGMRWSYTHVPLLWLTGLGGHAALRVQSTYTQPQGQLRSPVGNSLSVWPGTARVGVVQRVGRATVPGGRAIYQPTFPGVTTHRGTDGSGAATMPWSAATTSGLLGFVGDLAFSGDSRIPTGWFSSNPISHVALVASVAQLTAHDDWQQAAPHGAVLPHTD